MDIVNGSDKVDRDISKGKMNELKKLKKRNIKVVVLKGYDRE